MADLFKEIIPSILQTKKDVLDNEKDYKPFLVNRALSYHMDCILYANMMNLNPQLDGKLQYQYFLQTIRPMKRKFQPWQKASVINDVDFVKEYFGYSNEKAKEALRILCNEDLEIIKSCLEKGGVISKNTK
jgi:hypothetical protein